MNGRVRHLGFGMTSPRTRDRLVKRLRDKGIRDERVLAVMRSIPRHLFVDEALASRAYEESALPIGHGQTISQPYIVAVMSQMLGVGTGDRVFELGTGSAYQAAVLSELVAEVYTIEIVPELAASAASRLEVWKHVSFSTNIPSNAAILAELPG